MLDNLRNNRKVITSYITTKKNYLADFLSRLKIDQFREKALPVIMQQEPTELPNIIWPASKIWQK